MACAPLAIIDAIPILPEQDSTATGIPSRTSVQYSSGHPCGHHFTAMAQRTGSATGKESDQGSTCGRTTAPKLLSPMPPATDSNQPPRQSIISESSRHAEDEERTERGENRRRAAAAEIGNRRRRQDATGWENLQRMQQQQRDNRKRQGHMFQTIPARLSEWEY